MSVEAKFGNFFKSEIKTSGRKLLGEEKVSISSNSDTAIHAYVRATPPLKVVLSTDDIGSTALTADCSCPVAKKHQFCKHVWATLLSVEEKYPDFLSEKRTIEKPVVSEDARPTKEDDYKATAKARASGYRKEQYQRAKLRAKELKHKGSIHSKSYLAKSYPEAVEAALAYFTLNGFPMPEGPSEEIMGEAKRTLSRIFHPDKGGTHEESAELNKNCEMILRYLRGN